MLPHSRARRIDPNKPAFVPLLLSRRSSVVTIQDASFADAKAGLAHACFERALPLGGDLGVARQRKLLRRAKAEAQLAMDIDATLAEAHATPGMTLLFHGWDRKGAQKAMERTLELNSNSCLAHGCRAVLAVSAADVPRTLDEMRHALDLDPLNLLLRSEAAECCYWVRQYATAVAYASETLELHSHFPRAHFRVGPGARGIRQDRGIHSGVPSLGAARRAPGRSTHGRVSSRATVLREAQEWWDPLRPDAASNRQSGIVRLRVTKGSTRASVP